MNSLKYKFQAVARNVLDNSERLASAGYAFGNITPLVERGLHADMKTLASGLFLGCCVALWKAKENPLLMKIAGAFIMGGSTALAASGYGEPGFLSQAGSMIPVFFAGSLMATDSSKAPVADPSHKGITALWNRAYSAVRKNPVFAGAAIPFMGRPFLIYSAYVQNDLGLLLTAWSWTGSDVMLAASDPNVKKALKPLLKSPGHGISLLSVSQPV